MIKVYFETPNGSYAEVVAVFASEDLYMLCLPHLQVQASLANMIVTESVETDRDLNEL